MKQGFGFGEVSHEDKTFGNSGGSMPIKKMAKSSQGIE
jgi:hypothetical protein